MGVNRCGQASRVRTLHRPGQLWLYPSLSLEPLPPLLLRRAKTPKIPVELLGEVHLQDPTSVLGTGLGQHPPSWGRPILTRLAFGLLAEATRPWSPVYIELHSFRGIE